MSAFLLGLLWATSVALGADALSVFADFQERLAVADTVYVHLETPPLARATAAHRQRNLEFVLRAQARGPGGAPRVVVDGVATAEGRSYWDGERAWYADPHATPVRRDDVEDLLGELIQRAVAGFPDAVAVERDPRQDGILVTPDRPVYWVKVQAGPGTGSPVHMYLAFWEHAPHALDRLVVPTGNGHRTFLVSILEWDVPIDDAVFGPETQRTPLPPVPCWGARDPEFCKRVPPELVGRVTPSGETLGRLTSLDRGFLGLSDSGAQELCHVPAGWPEHAYTIEVPLTEVQPHLEHSDRLHRCRREDRARPDPQDPPGRLTLCHLPPGQPGRGRPMQVPAAAVRGHLGHGDYLGLCWPEDTRGNAPRQPGEPAFEPAVLDETIPPSGCGCATGHAGSGAVSLVALVALRRRRARFTPG